MGRQRSFDEDDVVAAAGSAFLRHGYEGTSIDDLLAATGLHRGSLYKAFASKRGLFVTVLQRRLAVDAAPSSDDGLDLLLVALLEVAPRDAEVRAICAQAIDRIGSGDGSEPSAVLGRRLLERGLITTSRKDTP